MPVQHAFALAGADRRSRLEAVHFRHLAIHQDKVEVLLRQLLDGGPAVAGQSMSHPERVEHGAHDLLIDRVVLGDQNVSGEGERCRHGRRRCGGGRCLGAQ